MLVRGDRAVVPTEGEMYHADGLARVREPTGSEGSMSLHSKELSKRTTQQELERE